MNIAKQISSRIFIKNHGEEGFVLVVSLVLLVILALFGMFATRMATTEYQIAGNERVYVKNFYDIESALMDFAQQIDDEESVKLEKYEVDGLVSSKDITDYDPSDKGQIAGNIANPDNSVEIDDKKVLAVNIGVPAGSSLDMANGSQVRAFDIFAQSQENGTNKIIKIGLKKRY